MSEYDDHQDLWELELQAVGLPVTVLRRVGSLDSRSPAMTRPLQRELPDLPPNGMELLLSL